MEAPSPRTVKMKDIYCSESLVTTCKPVWRRNSEYKLKISRTEYQKETLCFPSVELGDSLN